MNEKNIFLISLLALTAVVFANSAMLFTEADEQKKRSYATILTQAIKLKIRWRWILLRQGS